MVDEIGFFLLLRTDFGKYFNNCLYKHGLTCHECFQKNENEPNLNFVKRKQFETCCQ